MCGIVGIFSHQPVAAELHDSLIHLQHRGQDAAGILTCHERFYTKQGLGLVREIFTAEDMIHLKGHIGIGHTRYPTAGGYDMADIQPLWIGSPCGIALAHNGNLVNHDALAAEITQKKHRHLNSSIDSEVLLHLLADGLDQSGYSAEDGASFFTNLTHAVKQVFAAAQGSYSVVSVVIGKGLLAFRDPHGIRPLVMGQRLNADGTKDYIFASENTMFYALGFEPCGDVQPGEVVFVNRAGELFRAIVEKKQFTPCIFEYVYFARPDATINQISVYRSRLRMGQNLARHWQKTYPGSLPDVVIPAPFTSNTAALSFAHELGVRYSEGLYKNPFIGRTFIMPDGQDRSRQVRYKLTPQKTEIKDKIVLILDDSIVRGTTSREIVKMIREFGAKEIYFVSACPPIKNPCFYGIDIPSRNDLIAANDSLEAIANYLGVEKLLYQSLDDLVEAVTRKGEHHIERPCMACMDGWYVTGNIDNEKSAILEQQRHKGNPLSQAQCHTKRSLAETECQRNSGLREAGAKCHINEASSDTQYQNTSVLSETECQKNNALPEAGAKCHINEALSDTQYQNTSMLPETECQKNNALPEAGAKCHINQMSSDIQYHKTNALSDTPSCKDSASSKQPRCENSSLSKKQHSENREGS